MAYVVFSKAVTTKITIVSVSHFTLILPISMVILRFLKKMLLGSDGFGKNCIIMPHDSWYYKGSKNVYLIRVRNFEGQKLPHPTALPGLRRGSTLGVDPKEIFLLISNICWLGGKKNFVTDPQWTDKRDGKNSDID